MLAARWETPPCRSPKWLMKSFTCLPGIHILNKSLAFPTIQITAAAAVSARAIERLPNANTYVLTADGQRVAIFYTKVQHRLLRPLLAADQPPVPPTLRKALHTIDTHATQYIDAATLPLKAA